MQDVLGDKCLSSDDDMFGALSGARCQVSVARCYEVMMPLSFVNLVSRASAVMDSRPQLCISFAKLSFSSLDLKQ